MFGYNLTPGGDGQCGEDNPMFGKHHTEEAKRKMSEARKGKPKSEEFKKLMSEKMKNRKFSDETRKKMSENHWDCSGSNNYWYGKKRDLEFMKKVCASSKTPEAIEKMKKNKTWYSGGKNPNAKSVVCIETGKIYETVREAALDTGCNETKISAVCHGHREHTKNLHFKFAEEENG